MEKNNRVFIFTFLIFLIGVMYIISFNNEGNNIKYVKDNNSKCKFFYMYLKVSAYNSIEDQTDNDPYTGAWNNKVRKGMVAISRDLEEFGLTNKTPIILEGKEYTILDRMHSRKRKQVDIWMERKCDAEHWGLKVCQIEIPIEYIKIKKLCKEYKVNIIL